MCVSCVYFFVCFLLLSLSFHMCLCLPLLITKSIFKLTNSTNNKTVTLNQTNRNIKYKQHHNKNRLECGNSKTKTKKNSL